MSYVFEDTPGSSTTLAGEKPRFEFEESGGVVDTVKDTAKHLISGVGTGVITPLSTGLRMIGDAADSPSLKRLGSLGEEAGRNVSDYYTGGKLGGFDLSPAAKEAESMPVLDPSGEHFINPEMTAGKFTRKILGVGAESSAGIIPLWGLAAKAGRLAQAAKLGEGAAKTVGAAVSAIGEGAQAGLQNAGEEGRAVRQMDEAKLRASDEYNALRAQGIPHEDARERIAQNVERGILGPTALSTAALGYFPEKMFMGQLLGKDLRTGLVRKALKGAGVEALEEGTQSPAEQLWQNLAVNQHADPSRELGKDVAEQAIVGAATGGVMGAGHSAMFHGLSRGERDTGGPPPASEVGQDSKGETLDTGPLAAGDGSNAPLSSSGAAVPQEDLTPAQAKPSVNLQGALPPNSPFIAAPPVTGKLGAAAEVARQINQRSAGAQGLSEGQTAQPGASDRRTTEQNVDIPGEQTGQIEKRAGTLFQDYLAQGLGEKEASAKALSIARDEAAMEGAHPVESEVYPSLQALALAARSNWGLKNGGVDFKAVQSGGGYRMALTGSGRQKVAIAEEKRGAEAPAMATGEQPAGSSGEPVNPGMPPKTGSRKPLALDQVKKIGNAAFTTEAAARNFVKSLMLEHGYPAGDFNVGQDKNGKFRVYVTPEGRDQARINWKLLDREYDKPGEAKNAARDDLGLKYNEVAPRKNPETGKWRVELTAAGLEKRNKISNILPDKVAEIPKGVESPAGAGNENISVNQEPGKDRMSILPEVENVQATAPVGGQPVSIAQAGDHKGNVVPERMAASLMHRYGIAGQAGRDGFAAHVPRGKLPPLEIVTKGNRLTVTLGRWKNRLLEKSNVSFDVGADGKLKYAGSDRKYAQDILKIISNLYGKEKPALTAAPNQSVQRTGGNRPVISSSDPALTKLRKLGGIAPADPLFNDLAVQTGGVDVLRSLGLIRKDGRRLDDLRQAYNGNLGDDEVPLETLQDLFDFIEREIAAGRTTKERARRQAKDFVKSEDKYFLDRAREAMTGWLMKGLGRNPETLTPDEIDAAIKDNKTHEMAQRFKDEGEDRKIARELARESGREIGDISEKEIIDAINSDFDESDIDFSAYEDATYSKEGNNERSDIRASSPDGGGQGSSSGADGGGQRHDSAGAGPENPSEAGRGSPSQPEPSSAPRHGGLTYADAGEQKALFKGEGAQPSPAKTSLVDTVTRAVNGAYHSLAPLKGRAYDLTNELISARKLLDKAESSGNTVDYYDRNGDMFSTETYAPEAVTIAKMMEKHAGQPGKLTAILKQYAAEARAVGNPKETAPGLEPKTSLLYRAGKEGKKQIGGQAQLAPELDIPIGTRVAATVTSPVYGMEKGDTGTITGKTKKGYEVDWDKGGGSRELYAGVKPLGAKPVPLSTGETGPELPSLSLAGEPGNNSEFARRVDDFIAGKILSGETITVMEEAPEVLTLLGARKAPVEMAQRTLHKVLFEKHGGTISLEDLKTLPSMLERPIAVFQSRTNPDGLVVMTKLQDVNGKTVVAIMYINNMRERHVVHDIASLYGKDSNQFFIDEVKSERLLFLDKKKSAAWFQSGGTYSSKEGNQQRFGAAGYSSARPQWPMDSILQRSKHRIYTENDLVKGRGDGDISASLGNEREIAPGVESSSPGGEEAPDKHLPVHALRQVAKGFLERYKGAAGLKVVAVESPERIIAADGTPLGANLKARGAYVRSTNTVYLVAKNIRSLREAHEVLAHEILGHNGLEKEMGEAFDRLVDDAWKAFPELGAELSARYKGYAGNPEKSKAARREVGKEILATVMEKNFDQMTAKEKSLLNRIIAMVKKWMREHGFNVEFSRDQIIELLRNTARRMEKGTVGAREASSPGFFGEPVAASLGENNQAGGIQPQNKDVRVKVHLQVFDILGIKPAPVTANPAKLYKKHPEAFASQDEVLPHVEYVLDAPTHKFPGLTENVTLLVRRNGKDKAVAVEIEKVKGSYHVKSAYDLTPGQRNAEDNPDMAYSRQPQQQHGRSSITYPFKGNSIKEIALRTLTQEEKDTPPPHLNKNEWEALSDKKKWYAWEQDKTRSRLMARNAQRPTTLTPEQIDNFPPSFLPTLEEESKKGIWRGMLLTDKETAWNDEMGIPRPLIRQLTKEELDEINKRVGDDLERDLRDLHRARLVVKLLRKTQNRLEKEGWKIEESPQSNSFYARAPRIWGKNQAIRVSDHDLPYAPGRKEWDSSNEIVVTNRWGAPLYNTSDELYDAIIRLGRIDPVTLAGLSSKELDNPSIVEKARRLWIEKGTDSPFFKRWFKDSKVVDENGEPLVVYHFSPIQGTETLGKAFAGGDTRKSSFSHIGIFLTRDPFFQGSFSSKNNNDMPPHEFYVKGNLFNPVEHDSFHIAENFLNSSHGQEIKDNLEREYDEKDNDEKESQIIQRVADEIDKGTLTEINEILETSEFTGWLIDNGYDGVDTGMNLLVFSPTQIKSATGNRGTFDPENPDISFSLADEKGSNETKTGWADGIWDKPPVEMTEARPDRFKSPEEARQYLRKLRDSGRALRNDDTGWDIGLGGAGIKKTTNKAHVNNAYLQTIGVLPTLMKRAVLAFSEPTMNPRQLGHILAYHHFFAPARIENKLYTARLVVREQRDGKKFYEPELYEIIEVEPSPSQAPAHKPGSYGKDSISRINIRDMLRGVNPEDMSLSLAGETPGENPATPPQERESILTGLKDTFKALKEVMTTRGDSDSTFWSGAFWSMEYQNSPSLKALFNAVMGREGRKHEIFHELDMDTMENRSVAEILNALARKGLSWSEYYFGGKRSADYQALMEGITRADEKDWSGVKGDTDEERAADIMRRTEAELLRRGASSDVITAWKAFRRTMDRALEKMIAPLQGLKAEIDKEAEAQGVEPVYPKIGELSLPDALKMMGSLRGHYAPRLRVGDWAVTGKTSEGDLYREHFAIRLEAVKARNRLARQGYKLDGVSRVERTPEEVYAELGIVATDQAIKNAVAKMTGSEGLPSEISNKIMDELLIATANEIKSRGFRSSMIRRGESVVKGYMEDPMERYARYTHNTAAGLAKAEAARKMFEILSEMPSAKEPKNYRLAVDYISEQLRNADSYDRVIHYGKQAATVKYLWMNPKSALVNLTGLIINGPSAVRQYAADGKMSIPRAMGLILNAGSDYRKYMTSKKMDHLAEDERAFMERMHREGYDEPKYAQEAMGYTQDTLGKTWSDTVSVGMKFFELTERFNRGSTLLAAYRAAKSAGKSGTAAEDAAILATGRAHGIYGKGTLPTFMNNLPPAARVITHTPFIFMKYAHNYIQLLTDLGLRKKDIQGFLYSLAAPGVIGGAASLAFYGTAMGFINALSKALGDDRDKEKEAYKMVQAHFGNLGERTARYGLAGLAGVNLSGSLQIGGGVPRNLTEAAGAVGGIKRDLADAVDGLMRQDYWTAAEKAAPSEIGNIIKAYDEWAHGARTNDHRPIFDKDGKQYHPSAAEALAKAMSFTGADRSMLNERKWESKREMANFAENRKRIYDRYRAYIMAPEKDPEDKDAIIKMIKEYNQAVKGARGENGLPIPFITPAAMLRQMKEATRPNRKDLAMVS